MERNDENKWVAESLSALDPEWQADFARGRRLLDEGLAPRRRSWVWPAAAATAVVAVSLAVIPHTRVLAQQFWSHYVLNRVDVVRVDFSDLPLRAQVNVGTPQTVQDLDEAAQKAGFRPVLPGAGVLADNPSITVIGRIAAAETIHVAELETALKKARASDVQVPREWEGVEVRANIGPIVNLGYPGEIGILEAKPVELETPAGFPLQRFVETAFRMIGMRATDATALAQKFAANPGWLMGIPADEAANIEQVSLRTGPALLIEDFKDDGSVGRVTVLRSTSERIYCVLAMDRQTALRVAEALP
jgi:hypothetical protein